MASTLQVSRREAARPAPRIVEPPYGREEFHVTVLRAGKQTSVDALVTGFSWQEGDDGWLTGSLALRDPWPEAAPVLGIGDVVIVFVRAAGAWRELWRMRAHAPDAGEVVSIGLKDQGRTLSLSDDLLLLSRSTEDFRFVKDRKHPNGWRPDQIATAVCRRCGVVIGAMPHTRGRIKNMTKTGVSPLSVINDAFRFERTNFGTRFVIRMALGRLWITPLQSNSVLLNLGPSIVDGVINLQQSEAWATSLTVHTTGKKAAGSDAKGHAKVTHGKLTIGVTSTALVRKFGRTHANLTLKGSFTRAEARRRALTELTRRTRPQRTLQFTHPGIPGVRRGQAMYVRAQGLGRVLCYVKSVSHSVAPGDYTMDVTMQFSDPLAPTAADLVAQRKAKKKAAPKPKAAASRAEAA